MDFLAVCAVYGVAMASSSKTKGRSLKTRTYEEKLAIIEFQEKNQHMKQKDIAAKFGMSPQTLSDILKSKKKIKDMCATDFRAPTAKRQRVNDHPDVDKALILWFRQKSSRPEIRIDCGMMLMQANKFRQQFSPESAELAPAWIDRFKKRYGLGRITKAGESGGVDTEVVEEWKSGKLREILKNYEPKDIYNADETGLFWLLLPDNSIGFIGQSHHGAKQPKSRLTVLVGSNMDGSDKLPLLVIGKSKKPRAFKNVEVPVLYEANKKAWMLSSLFEAWLKKLDRRMAFEKRKIVMVVDNCPAHPTIELNNIELVFLPPNTTSHTQPMDSGIIKNLKYFYRRTLALRRLEATDDNAPPFSWTILDAVIALKSAWKRVTAKTIENCYRKAGFERPAEIADDVGTDDQVRDEAPEVVEDTSEEEVTNFRNIWSRLRDLFGEAVPSNPDDYLSVDDNVETVQELTDEQIVEVVRDPSAEEGLLRDEEEDEQMDVEKPPPELNDAYSALRTLRYYGLAACPELEDLADQMETLLLKQSQLSMHQTKITDFFK